MSRGREQHNRDQRYKGSGIHRDFERITTARGNHYLDDGAGMCIGEPQTTPEFVYTLPHTTDPNSNAFRT